MRPIVIEGPDGSGKSSLAKKLSVYLKLPIHHPGGPPVNRTEFLDRMKFCLENKDKYIFDRCPHISELVYPEATGRLGIVGKAALYDQLNLLRPLVIFCRVKSIKTMWDSINRNDKPHKPAQHLSEVLLQYKKIVEGYDKAIKDLALSTEIIYYDREDKSYTQLLLEIRKCVD